MFFLLCVLCFHPRKQQQDRTEEEGDGGGEESPKDKREGEGGRDRKERILPQEKILFRCQSTKKSLPLLPKFHNLPRGTHLDVVKRNLLLDDGLIPIFTVLADKKKTVSGTSSLPPSPQKEDKIPLPPPPSSTHLVFPHTEKKIYFLGPSRYASILPRGGRCERRVFFPIFN